MHGFSDFVVFALFLLSIFFIKFEKSNIYTFEKDEFSAELPITGEN